MAQKLLTLTNYFKNGLVMDLSPTNTPDSCLSNALNATLVTYNGNEFSLQNDMGNGRVETASLPQGYIPVGTCSFGGIIYIVSYNPLENKSLIGCFPSPERNIESDDLSEFTPILSENEFVELDDNHIPTGKVHKYSTKKLLTVNSLNPGDKFVIHWDDDSVNNTNYSTTSNFGNPSKLNDSTRLDWPKLMRIRLVGIEDSGKINYLDSSVQWYEYSNKGPYFLKETPENTSENNIPDIDAYRNSVNGAYSVFLSKVSGKLALLIDLERINTFSTSYKITKSSHIHETSNDFDYFDIYLSSSWDTDNPNVNPIGLIITDASISKTNDIKDFIFVKYNEENTIIEETKFNGNNDEGISGNRNRTDVYEYTYDIYDAYNDVTTRYNPRTVTTYEEFHQNNYFNIVDGYSDIVSIESTQDNYQYDDDLTFTETFTDGTKIENQIIPADIVVNRFNDDVLTFIGTVKIPKTQTSSGYTYKGAFTFTVAPCMEYGVLDDLAVSAVIDFSLYNYGIELTHWKYSVTPNALQLTWGLKTALGSEIREITSVVMDFYDFMGHAARFTASNYESYNGLFTEYIALNSIGGNSNISYSENNIRFSHYIPVDEVDYNNLNDYRIVYSYSGDAFSMRRHASALYVIFKDNQGNPLYYYKFANPSDDSLTSMIEQGSLQGLRMRMRRPVYFDLSATPPSQNIPNLALPPNFSEVLRTAYEDPQYSHLFKVFKNDAGTLYYGRLYQVTITINYKESGLSQLKIYHRWLWNNGIYNDKLHTNDFDVLPLPLKLSAQISLDGRDLKELSTTYFNQNLLVEMPVSYNHKSLGALITSIGYENMYSQWLLNNIPGSTLNNEGLVEVGTTSGIRFNLENLPNWTRRYRNYYNNSSPNYSKESVQQAINGNTGLIYLNIKPGFSNQANFVFNTNYYNLLTIKVATNNPKIILTKNNTEITPDDLQHIYSDGDKFNKEFIKPVIASVNELNSSSYDTPIKEHLKNHETLVSQINQSNLNADIYYTADNYQNFKDWFSLEVLDKTSNQDSFLYIDESGENQSITTEYTELGGQEAANGIGFALKLKGVCYSKAYAYSSILNNNCKILKSLLYRESDWNNYNLAHDLNGAAYFKKGLFLKIWYTSLEYDGDSVFNVEYQMDEVTYNSVLEANGIDFNPTYNNGALAVAGDYTYGDYDEGYSQYAGTFTTNSRNDKVISLIKMMSIAKAAHDYGFIPLTLSESVTQWDTNSRIYLPGSINAYTDNLFDPKLQQSILCITNSEHSSYNPNQALNGSSFIPLAEPVRTNGGNYALKNVVGIPVLQITWADNSSNPSRLADMVASLLGQVYTWDGLKTSLVYKYTNLVTLEDYQEVWLKDIISKITINSSALSTYQQMVALLDITSVYISLYDIINRTVSESNIINQSDINLHNVSPFTINNLDTDNSDSLQLTSTQCFAFKYNTNYDVNSLLNAYEDSGVYIQDFTNQNNLLQVNSDSVSIEQNKGYCITSDNRVSDLDTSNDFYILSNYSELDGFVYTTKTSNLLQLAPYSDLNRAFVFKGNILRINPQFLLPVAVDHNSTVNLSRRHDDLDGRIKISNFGMTNKLFNYNNL